MAGYNVEYSSIPFALFFLGEYANMILTSAMMTILFMGGWLPPFGIEALAVIPGIIWFALKISFLLFIFIWVRAALPRYRYDQLMFLGWKVLLPLTLVWLILTIIILFFFFIFLVIFIFIQYPFNISCNYINLQIYPVTFLRVFKCRMIPGVGYYTHGKIFISR